MGGNTTVYKYDKGGNIQFKKVYSYSAASGKTYSELLNGTTGKAINYGYGVSGNKDLLTSYNGSGILEYDSQGYPQKWFKHGTNNSSLDYTLQWGNANNLVMVEDVGTRDIYTYMYNDQGIRTFKFVNDVMHTYYLQGEQIIAEKYGNRFIKFYYDGTGICGFNFNGTDYYYQKNIQGDILKIYDGNGNLYAEYGYDAWGKCTIKTNVSGIAAINPFRYRGYYLDDETGLYYLNARYYDPEIGRFISPDSIDYLDPESIGGLNLYEYCDNNPVIGYDPSGNIDWSRIFGWIATVVLAVVGVGLIVLTGGLAAAGVIAAGGFAASVMVGAGVGILAGIGGSLIAQGGFGNLTNINPWAVFTAGLIGGAIGAVSGAASYGFAQIGQSAGSLIGNVLSGARHIGTGVRFAKVYNLTTSTLMNVGGFIGKFVGGSVSGIGANFVANNIVETIFGAEYRVDNPNYIRSGILKLFQWLYPVR